MDDPADTQADLAISPPDSTRLNAQTIALAILAILAVFYALSVASELVVPLLLAMMLKLMLQPVMRFLRGRLKLPMGVAAFVLILGLLGLIGGIGATVAVPASGWIAKAPQGLQTLEDQLSLLRDPIEAVQRLVQRAEHLAAPAGDAPAVAGAPAPPAIALGSVGMSVLVTTQQFFGRFFVLALTLFFLLAAGDSMLRKLVEATPGFEEKKHVVYIMTEIERNVSRYLGTITAINASVGVLTGLAVYACGIADPVLWGYRGISAELHPDCRATDRYRYYLCRWPADLRACRACRVASGDLSRCPCRGRAIRNAAAAVTAIYPEPGDRRAVTVFLALAVGHSWRAAVGAAAGDDQDHLRPYSAPGAVRAYARSAEPTIEFRTVAPATISSTLRDMVGDERAAATYRSRRLAGSIACASMRLKTEGGVQRLHSLFHQYWIEGWVIEKI